MKQQSVWPDRDSFIFCAGPPLQQQSSPPLVMRLLTNIRAKLETWSEILQVLFPTLSTIGLYPSVVRSQANSPLSHIKPNMSSILSHLHLFFVFSNICWDLKPFQLKTQLDNYGLWVTASSQENLQFRTWSSGTRRVFICLYRQYSSL